MIKMLSRLFTKKNTEMTLKEQEGVFEELTEDVYMTAIAFHSKGLFTNTLNQKYVLYNPHTDVMSIGSFTCALREYITPSTAYGLPGSCVVMAKL